MKTLLDDQRAAARIVSDIIMELKSLTRPGVAIDMLAELALRRIKEQGATSFNLGYQPAWAERPFPAAICSSVNYEVCHGSPRGRALSEGDIVNYDLGIRYKSGCGDAAMSVAVGEVSNRKQRLLRYASAALDEGIKEVRVGASLSCIGTAIEQFAGRNGYQVIKEFAGHYIGKEVHEEPTIDHVYRAENNNKFLKEGDVICLEPILTPGKGVIDVWGEDGWTAYCVDGQPAAMFEAMLIVGKDGCEVLTKNG